MSHFQDIPALICEHYPLIDHQVLETAWAKTMVRAKRFMHKEKSTFESRIIAHTLMNCSEITPCCRSACNRCTTVLQHASASILVDKLSNENMKVFSIIAPEQIPFGFLTHHSIVNFKEYLETTTSRAGIEFGYLLQEVSFNRDKSGRFNDHYQLQSWGFVRKEDAIKLKSEIMKSNTSNYAVKRPVVAKAFDGNPRAILYGLKNQFNLRQSYIPAGQTLRNTRNKKLNIAHEIEICVALDRAGFDARILAINHETTKKFSPLIE